MLVEGVFSSRFECVAERRLIVDGGRIGSVGLDEGSSSEISEYAGDEDVNGMVEGNVIGTKLEFDPLGTGVVFERFLLLFRSFLFSPFHGDESVELVEGE